MSIQNKDLGLSEREAEGHNLERIDTFSLDFPQDLLPAIHPMCLDQNNLTISQQDLEVYPCREREEFV